MSNPTSSSTLGTGGGADLLPGFGGQIFLGKLCSPALGEQEKQISSVLLMWRYGSQEISGQHQLPFKIHR